MSSTDLTPASDNAVPDDGSALRALLDHAIPYEKAGAVIPHDLLQFGLLGSGIVIATGLLALTLPDSAAIRHSDFYLVLGSLTASLDTVMGRAASPALICGGILLVLDACLMQVRTSSAWRYTVVAQAIAGGIGGAFCTVFLALIILNLAIWIAIIALAVVILGVILGMMAGG